MITQKLNWNRFTRAFALAFLGLAALVGTGASAQTTTGTVRGTVTTSGAGSAGAQVQLRNPATGVSRGTSTRDDGTYILAGIVPATYEMTVRRIGSSPETRIITVQIGTSQIQDFSLSQQASVLETVQVRAAGAIDTRTSEVSTNVTQAQIAKLPTASRNFLDLAALTPGVSVTEDRINGASRTVSAGGQSSNAVNLFIDGTSFKNDLTNGGIAGQDASKGNPFPRGAIQEYRVISQNFKAEYQKASSAVITATTKSGTNTFTGNLVYSYQDQDLVALDTFQLADKKNNANFSKPDYKRNLAALSLGGPIIKDKLHFFATYEGNYQDRNNRVNFTPPTGFAAIDTVNFRQYNGNFTSPFRETLLFGKLSLAINEKSSAEFSVHDRIETDIRDFGDKRPFQQAVNFRQNIGVGQVKYNYFSGAILNEAKADYSRFRRNPEPNTPGLPGRQYFFPDNSENQLGSFRSTQDFIQSRFAIRDDLTYTGFQLAGDHVFKLGGNLDFVKYDVIKDNDGTPVFRYRQTENGQTYNFGSPYELFYGTGDPNLNENNTQVGLYVQDDWRPIPQLTLNLGIRWDYESNMLNNDFVTNAQAADTLRRYNAQFPNPLDLDRYISDGDSRKAFMKAFQPRLGFSYAVDKAARTTVFGGFGIYYDRVPFDLVIDEKLKLSHPSFTVRFAPRGVAPLPGQIPWNDSYLGASKQTLDALVGTFGRPEAWFIDNEAKVPWSKQWSAGVRQAIGDFTIAGTYAGVRGYDQFTMNWAQFGLNPNGSCCTSFDIGAHGYSNFIYSSNGKKTWYDSFQLQIDRPYQSLGENQWGWGFGLAYTYAVRSLEGTDGLDDLFAFPNDDNIPKHPSNDEKNRIVTNWIVDIPYLWGIQFSGLATFGGKYKIDVGCPPRFCGDAYERGGFTVPGTFPYRVVDIRFRKDFPEFSNARLGITADVFNLLNRNNYGCYNTGNPSDANFGKPGCVVSDPRRLQVGLEIDY